MDRGIPFLLKPMDELKDRMVIKLYDQYSGRHLGMNLRHLGDFLYGYRNAETGYSHAKKVLHDTLRDYIGMTPADLMTSAEVACTIIKMYRHLEDQEKARREYYTQTYATATEYDISNVVTYATAAEIYLDI